MDQPSNVRKIFWDIEAYRNLFCCGMLDDDNHLEMFYKVSSEEDAREVERACQDSGFEYTLYDLSKDMSRFKWHFEKRIPKPAGNTVLDDFLGTETKEVKPKENWYFGYNTLQYDIPMCDHLIQKSLANRLQTTTESIREFSDTLILGTNRYVDVRSYEQYANQVDCAYLNEKMIANGRPSIGLKTLVGVKGGSIIESESNKSGFSESIYEDVVYNINDITELRDVVYPGVMETTFKNRLTLIQKFPKLSENGVTVNSTSAKFVEYIVAPDGPIEDTETVSFLYPAKHVAERLGVEQKDVLDDTVAWYMKNVYHRVKANNPTAAENHLRKFMSVIYYYATIRGKNWNESANHALTYGISPQPKENRKKLFDEFGTFLPFIDEFGNDSYTYANFSIGGIHGAEVNVEQLTIDRKKIAELKEKYGKISMIPKGEVSQSLLNLIKMQSRETFKDYAPHLSHEIPYLYQNTKQVDEIINPEDFTPYMYNTSKKKEELITRYKYTSAGEAVHQDFAGYYPMLLINLGAFHGGEGHDPYEEVYNFRISVKHKLKTMTYGTPEYELVDIEQNGYKLVLNSASGVLDGSFDTNLRANNKALAMRAIGQLFTWRIGMALAIEGARVPSSNTDGIYVFDMELEKNKAIVNRELKELYIEIDPEPMYLVSKDTNNRMEMEDGRITSARGGTLTSWNGADVDTRLAHPALSDKVLTIYLQDSHLLDGPVDKAKIREAIDSYYENIDVLKEFKDYPDAEKRTFVYMASWVMRSTSGSILIDDTNTVYDGTIRTWLTSNGHLLSRYMTRKSKPSARMEEWAEKLFPETRLGDPDIISYLTEIGAYEDHLTKAITVQEYLDTRIKEEKNGKTVYHMPDGGEKSVPIVAESKVSNLPDGAHVTINNESLLKMSEEDIDAIYQQIDFDHYVELIAEKAKAWHNVLQPS